MAVNLKQNADASMGLQGSDGDDGGFITVSYVLTSTAPTAGVTLVTPSRRMILKSANLRTDAAVTGGNITLFKSASGTSISGGTAMCSATAVNTTLNTNSAISLTSGTTDIPANSSVGFTMSGAISAGTSTLTLTFAPA